MENRLAQAAKQKNNTSDIRLTRPNKYIARRLTEWAFYVPLEHLLSKEITNKDADQYKQQKSDNLLWEGARFENRKGWFVD